MYGMSGQQIGIYNRHGKCRRRRAGLDSRYNGFDGRRCWARTDNGWSFGGRDGNWRNSIRVGQCPFSKKRAKWRGIRLRTEKCLAPTDLQKRSAAWTDRSPARHSVTNNGNGIPSTLRLPVLSSHSHRTISPVRTTARAFALCYRHPAWKFRSCS